VARTAEQLTLAFGKFNDTSASVYANWVEGMATEVSRAITEGDLREDLDPIRVSEAIIGATFGTRILSQSTPSGDDLIGRLTLMWELLFPAIVTDSSLAYYHEYLAREALRHTNHDPSP
jgi:hypothetical protein